MFNVAQNKSASWSKPPLLIYNFKQGTSEDIWDCILELGFAFFKRLSIIYCGKNGQHQPTPARTHRLRLSSGFLNRVCKVWPICSVKRQATKRAGRVKHPYYFTPKKKKIINPAVRTTNGTVWLILYVHLALKASKVIQSKLLSVPLRRMPGNLGHLS